MLTDVSPPPDPASASTMLAWLPLLIALAGWTLTFAGWIVSHRMALRAQRKQFINSVRNEARKDVIRTIRAQQQWLGEIAVELTTVPYVAARLGENTEAAWQSKADAITAHLRGEPADSVLITLEEYETLFPETRVCRGGIQKLIGAYLMAVSRAASDIRHGDNRESGIEASRALASVRQNEVLLLLEDLRVHLQNEVLGTITGHKVLQRRAARFDGVARLQLGEDGQLRITDAGIEDKSHGR